MTEGTRFLAALGMTGRGRIKRKIASYEEAVALMSGHAKELQRLLDKGMAAAVRNAQEEGAKENAAEDGGGKYSLLYGYYGATGQKYTAYFIYMT